MNRFQKIRVICLVLFGTVFDASPVVAGSRFSEMVIDFPGERPFEYLVDAEQNALVLSFKNTIPSELKALDTYDERLIKRVFIKELGTQGTEVKLVFRDRNVRAIITKQNEPFRISISLFDKDYSQKRDPLTGLPLAGVGDFGNQTPVDDHLKLLNNNSNVGFDNNSTAPTKSQASESGFGRRKLLQPAPDEITSLDQLTGTMKSIQEGRSKHWKDFPPYVYPIKTAVYQGRKNPSGYLKRISSQALTSAQAMAEYGYKLFSFGHESKALAAYQQVLHRDPGVFDKDALHLWAFAEIHLGQRNLTLADGYFSNLVNKHPDSPLSKFAKLRRLDIKAIRALQSNKKSYLAGIAKDLNGVDQGNNSELAAQIGIRKAYWRQEGHGQGASVKYLPHVKDDLMQTFSRNLPNVEGQRTAFLVSSILVKNMIRKDAEWDSAKSQFIGDYFKKYRGKASEPYYSALKEELQNRLKNLIVERGSKGEFADVVNMYSSLPKAMRSIGKTPSVAWYIGESFKNTGEKGKALSFYNTYSKNVDNNPKVFKSLFWAAVLNSQMAEESSKSNIARKYRNAAQKADRRMEKSWAGLSPKEQQEILASFKGELEGTISTSYRLKTPSVLVLQSWTKQLSTKKDATSGSKATEWSRNFSPTGSAVAMLSELAGKFSEMGMKSEKRQTIKLLKQFDPNKFTENEKAKRIWAKELLSLAEEYRSANNYLEAGRLYAFTAKNNPSADNRAESLYKGGLLLFRAGKRQEAVEAFTAASEDGNNLFYANLAKERLSQLQQ